MRSQSWPVNIVFVSASNIVRISTFANEKVFFICFTNSCNIWLIMTEKLRNLALRNITVDNYLWPLHGRKYLKIHQAVGKLFLVLIILDHQ